MKVCDCPSCNYYRAVKERNDRIAADRRIRDGEVAFDTRTESAPVSGPYQIDGMTARLIRDGSR